MYQHRYDIVIFVRWSHEFLRIAENSALNYFWWFMVVTAFTGTSLSTAIVNGFNEGIAIGQQFQVVVEQTASSIPTEVSATWLNWMIVRVTMVLPTQYLLQLNTFLLASFRMKPCTRAVRGGGKYSIDKKSSIGVRKRLTLHLTLCLFTIRVWWTHPI